MICTRGYHSSRSHGCAYGPPAAAPSAPPLRAAVGAILAVAAALLLPACSGGGGATGNSDPGSGGGPRGPGGTGNPLDIALDFSVANDAEVARTETVLASVPFPRGPYQPNTLQTLVVSGHQTAWRPLQLWWDGSVKVAQAQFTDEFQPGQVKNYTIARDEQALGGTFQPNPWVQVFAPDLVIGAEVRDTFQVAYRGFATGSGEVLHSSPLVRTKRHRAYHTAVQGGTGIGRDYLTSTFYVTEYRDMPFVVVDWLLGNDYLGADVVPPGNTDPNLRALGTVDVRAARFLCRGASGVQPYRPVQEAIAAAEALPGGFTAFRVMQDDWLGDAQTRRYRFLLRFEPPGAAASDLQRWQATANAMLQRPLYPLASQQAWEQTGAAGLVGGPIPGPADANARARSEYNSWAGFDWFGTWGRRGDPLATGTTGTPRNHPLSPEFAHAVQGQYHLLVQKLEQMAWAQAMRPYHLWNLQVGAEQQILLWDGTPMLLVQGETLGRRALRDSDPYPQYRTLSVGQPRAHGWEHFDHEHWSTDLLFDYWTLSGDAWAQEELRQLGESLKGLMRLTYYYTANIQAARAEGWCMQGFAQVYQVTRDETLKAYALRRVDEIIEVQRRKNHPSRAMTFQPNYANTGYPMNHEFFMAWHHGAVLYGFLGAYTTFQAPQLLRIAEDVVETVEYSWVVSVNHPQFGFVPQGLRYYTPATHNGTPVAANYWDNLPQGIMFGDSPLGGAHTFLIGGLHILANYTPFPAVRAKALQYGGVLRGTMTPNNRWSKWHYCLPPEHAQ